MPYHLAIPHRYGNKSSFMLYKVLSALRMKFMSDSFQHFVSKKSNGDPYGIRTRDTAVKGRCLNRLTKGPYKMFVLCTGNAFVNVVRAVPNRLFLL